jgi:hypothetical protein
MRLCWMPLLSLVAGTTFAQSRAGSSHAPPRRSGRQVLEGPDHSYSPALTFATSAVQMRRKGSPVGCCETLLSLVTARRRDL